MFGIGMPELIIILVIALIVIGPKKLPDLAKALGKGMAEFRKATTELKDGLNLDSDLKEVREDLADAVSGVNEPLPDSREKASQKEKKQKFDNFDDMLDTYHQDTEGSEKKDVKAESKTADGKTPSEKNLEKSDNGE